MATIIVAVLVLGDHIILPITRSQCISRLAPAARRQQRSSSSTSSTYTTEDDSGDIIHSSLLGGGSVSSISKSIAGRLIRNKNTQRQQRKSPTETTLSTDGAMPTQQQQQQQQQFRGDQRLLVRHLNIIPVHSLGNSNLSATDLYRWRHVKHLNNEQNETMFGSNKGRLGDHRNNNHYLGGSIVALQSATVKYRKLRLQQQQQQYKQRKKQSIFSSTEQQNNDVTGITPCDNHDGRGIRRHQLKPNPSAKTIPLILSSSDTIIITSHSTIHNSKASSSASVEANERYDGASTKTTSTTMNGWLFAPWLWGRRNK